MISHRGIARRCSTLCIIMALAWLCPPLALAQNAELSGVVRDPQGAAVAGAQVMLTEIATGVTTTTTSNGRGIYLFPSLRPSTYRLRVAADGFAPAVREQVVLNVEQRLVFDMTLAVAGTTEEVTVAGGRSFLGTADGSVGTVIDRRFAADLPTRGRSFSALVGLAPGVNLSGTANSNSGSEFSVNGQRTTSNTLTVDGVSGVAELDSAGFDNAAGQRFASTVSGTVNGGVSMDAVQEIRVQTSSFAAEFGRSPGAQISIVTRSGTNTVHGSLFEQFRDDRLMANDWFVNNNGLAKPEQSEHQFGGTIGGPVIRNRTFFFASYEGVRVKQAPFGTLSVPSLEARQQPSRAQALLNRYPLPTGPTQTNQLAAWSATPQRRNVSDTWGMRVDHALSSGLRVFGRYARVPSSIEDDSPLATAKVTDKLSNSLTTGLTATLGSRMLVEVRASYSDAEYGYTSGEDPALRAWYGVMPDNAWTRFSVSSMAGLFDGQNVSNIQRQANVESSVSYLTGAHNIKAGFNYRRLEPTIRPTLDVNASFQNLSQVLADVTVPTLNVTRSFASKSVFENVSTYVQDTWKAFPRLSVTYGVRWDVNPAPSFGDNEGPLAVETFEPIRSLRLTSSQNVPLWKTNYGNVFPRVGFSYAIGASARYVLSGGAGIFGDLEGAAATVNVAGQARISSANVRLPFTAANLVGPDRPFLTPPFSGDVTVVDPNLETPRVTQWNLSLERALGDDQAVSITYVGAHGEDLLQTRGYSAGLNADFIGTVSAREAIGKSRYQSLQLQYRRRAAAGLQVLASYAFSDSKDTASSLFGVDRTHELHPTADDLRHSGKAAVSWTVPDRNRGSMGWLLRDWTLNAIGTARSAYPFSVLSGNISAPGEEQFTRYASLVPGVSLTIDDPGAPGGRRFNRAAFVEPPAGQRGDTHRNQFRGFSAVQVDAGIQRGIQIAQTKVQLRLDAFNVFNTPVFGYPRATLSDPLFGMSTTNAVPSSQSALYRVGGPRSLALSARLEF